MNTSELLQSVLFVVEQHATQIHLETGLFVSSHAIRTAQRVEQFYQESRKAAGLFPLDILLQAALFHHLRTYASYSKHFLVDTYGPNVSKIVNKLTKAKKTGDISLLDDDALFVYLAAQLENLIQLTNDFPNDKSTPYCEKVLEVLLSLKVDKMVNFRRLLFVICVSILNGLPDDHPMFGIARQLKDIDWSKQDASTTVRSCISKNESIKKKTSNTSS